MKIPYGIGSFEKIRLKVFFLLPSFFLSSAFAQFTDNFADGDFNNNPAWSGDDSIFVVNASNELQSNGYAQFDTAFLTTLFSPSFGDTITWEFYVKMLFSPSDNNRVSVFLASNISNLQGPLNGYYIRIGENGSSDAIKLYRQSGLNSTLILTGTGSTFSTNPAARIKVVRDPVGNWTVYSDTTGGTNFIMEQTVQDTVFTSSTHFGIWCKYSLTNSKNFIFDDFVLGGNVFVDTVPPILNTVTVPSSTQLDLRFSEFISQTSAETLINYSVNNGIGNPATAVRDAADSTLVHLTFTNTFSNGVTHTIAVSGIQDLAGNTMVATNQNFMYFVPDTAVYKDVVINEIYADINPVVGLPAAEMVELFNRSAKILVLTGWKFSDGTSTATLGNIILAPDSFLILCSTSNDTLYAPFGTTLGITGFPSLNDGGDNLSLSDSSGTLIDAVSYSSSMYQDTAKDNGGWTLELINPLNPCSDATNWIASNAPSGGTPGKQNSVYDTLPDAQAPSLISVTVTSPNTIALTFSEPMDTASLLTGTYTIDNGNQVYATSIPPGNNTVVSLTLGFNIDTGIVYTISVAGASDCSGNLIGANDSLQFLIGATPAKKDVLINEFMAILTPNPPSLPDREYIELYNTSSKIFNLSDWKYLNNSSVKILPSYILMPGSYLILCSAADTALFSPYGNILGISWSTLADAGASLSLTDNSGNPVDAVTYSSSWSGFTGGIAMELINPENPCGGTSNWRASLDVSGGTPGKINSVYSNAADTTRPIVTGVTVVSEYQIQVDFNETMDSATLATGNYVINNGISVADQQPQSPDFTSVILTLDSALDSTLVYTIFISQVSDCPGNQILTQVLSLAMGVKPNSKDIIINEIYANPNASLSSLPEVEFVELYNKTSKAVNLSGCKFSDPTTSVTISNAVIFPSEYLILCAASSTGDYINYGRTIGLPAWPTLNNAGDYITLKNSSGSILDEVNYYDTWYADNVKKTGGWTLELINPDAPCSGANNWRASMDAAGGTPGKLNSIYSTAPDTTAPSVMSINAVATSQIQINFNEGMDTASLANGNYVITPDSFSVINIQPISPDYASVLLNIAPPLDSASVYMIFVSQVSDCPGNPLPPDSFLLAIGVAPGIFDVVINEIFPAPDSSLTSLPEAEFVELYNTTSNAINLNGCKFSDASASATLTNAVIFPYEYLILCASANAGNYKNYGRVSGLSSLPLLNNSGDNLMLKDSSGNIIHRVDYLDDWYNDEVKKDGGWTLEMIDPANPCGEENNWRASNDLSGGTPGKINSIKGVNPDVAPPQLAGAYAVNTTTVILYFNEITDSLSMLAASYAINNGIGISSVAVLGKDNVQLNLSSALQVKALYTVTVSGTTDCIPNTTSGSATEFALSEKGVAGDILINEVLYDPRTTGGAELVEIYNNSDKVINLQYWRLGRYPANSSAYLETISEYPLMLFPKEYLVFTGDTENIKKEYPLGKPENYFQLLSMISLTDSATLLLYTGDSAVSDFFSYNKDMHFDLLKATKGVSLERIDFNRNTNDAGNWHSAAEAVGWATPGYQNSQYNPSQGDGSAVSVEPEIFSPDNDGFNDVTNIHYKFESPGFVATVQIYDAKGRLIKTIAKSQILSPEGIFTWDGISDNNEKARIGIYIVYFEAFDLSGKVLHFKKTCVVAGKMN